MIGKHEIMKMNYRDCGREQSRGREARGGTGAKRGERKYSQNIRKDRENSLSKKHGKKKYINSDSGLHINHK